MRFEGLGLTSAVDTPRSPLHFLGILQVFADKSLLLRQDYTTLGVYLP
jgi:hypothetical protein